MTAQQSPARPRYTHEQWKAEGTARFGPDVLQWKFVCPACGYVASLDDFKALDADPGRAVVECVGRRLNELGWREMVYREPPTEPIGWTDEDDPQPIYAEETGPSRRESGLPCDWAAFGLFGTLNSGTCVSREGEEDTWAFDFAPAGS